MSFEENTLSIVNVVWHQHGNPTLIRKKWRCTTCGHRLAKKGEVLRQSRSMPPWTWHREVIDRYRARHKW